MCIRKGFLLYRVQINLTILKMTIKVVELLWHVFKMKLGDNGHYNRRQQARGRPRSTPKKTETSQFKDKAETSDQVEPW